MFLMYDLTGTPYMSIGEFLGGRDHTTIIHGVEKVTEENKANTQTKLHIENIKRMLETTG